MRDLVVVGFVFGSLPFILRKPFYGVLVWTLLGLLNPHRLCWGFAVTMPLAQIVALVLLGSVLISKEEKALPNHYLVILLAGFWVWMFLSTLYAFAPGSAWMQLEKVSKILLMVFVTILLLKDKVRIVSLVAVIVLSLGFYGVKGGIFTLMTGGSYRVYGPSGSFMAENNATAMALIMTVPYFRFFQLQIKTKRVSRLFFVGLLLLIVSVFGSQSRGAFLGLGAMVVFLVGKGKNRVGMLLLMAIFGVVMLAFMPEEYMARMETVGTYEQDASAMGRINAWITTWRVVMDHPVLGGGYNMLMNWAYPLYGSEFRGRLDVHSIYFEVLGEHGFVGLALFLGIGFGSFLTAGRVARRAATDERLAWIRDLAKMIQVSIVGYAVCGAFLGLAYFDFVYVIVALVIGLDVLLRKYEKEGIPDYEGLGLFQMERRGESAEEPQLRGNRTAVRRRMPIPRKKGMNVLESIKAWYVSL